MRGFGKILGVVTAVLLLPAAAFAQASIAGTVKDTSGAVLPGVTVEAASPVLIEKTRSVVTDGSGNYKIENLRPGTYGVTFTLTGFNTVKRDGIELTGSFVATVNADMKVGAIEETITVTGETPVVDIQSTQRERVMSKDIIDALPTGRYYGTLGVLVPGVNSSSKDVGGSLGDTMASLTAHGGATGDQRILENGLNVMTLQTGGGNIGGMVPNTGAAQEVAIDTAAASAERQTGGVVVNFIPKDGGNTVRGTVFGTVANESMASSNLTQRIRDLGLNSVDSIKKNYDINPGVGGPIKKDKLWFYYTGRYNGAQNYAAGQYVNLNAFDPSKFTYAPDTTKQALSLHGDWWDHNVRVTYQMNPKNKFAGTYDQQYYCRCPNSISSTTDFEASNDRRFPVQQLIHGEWWSPVTNKLLIEFVGLHRTERWGNMDLRMSSSGGSFDNNGFFNGTPAQFALYPSLVAIQEQNALPGFNSQGNFNYHGPAANGVSGSAFNNNWVPSYHYRAAVSYVTGSHAFKFGYQDAVGYLQSTGYDFLPYRERFGSSVVGGVVVPKPNQITVTAGPFTDKSDQQHDLGLFAQDKWTINRLTLNYGVRYDYYASSYPAQHLGPGLLFPNRNADFAAEDNLNWKDVTPRVAVSYDLFGDGKTAIKASANKYVTGQALGGLGSNTNPILRLALSTTRTWTDGNGNFIPDCDLTNNAVQNNVAKGGDFCGAPSNPAFGTLNSTQVTDSGLRTGWNVRGYNWEFSAGVQREVIPRVSVDVSYFRRIFGNLTVTDNLAVGPNDVSLYSITAPSDPRLPGGGTYTITGIPNLTSAAAALTPQNSTVLVKSLPGSPNAIQHWNGVDFAVNARLTNGLLLQGGVSTGKTLGDFCDVLAVVPEAAISNLTIPGFSAAGANTSTPLGYCKVESPFITQVKANGAYTIPKALVQVAATFQSIPGNALNATFNVPNAQAQASLGRPLSSNATQQTISLLTGGNQYQDRLNQLDFRVGKVLRFGRTRTAVNLDVFNALNVDTVTGQNNALTLNANTQAGFANSLWVPTGLIQSRFLKISAQFDF